MRPMKSLSPFVCTWKWPIAKSTPSECETKLPGGTSCDPYSRYRHPFSDIKACRFVPFPKPRRVPLWARIKVNQVVRLVRPHSFRCSFFLFFLPVCSTSFIVVVDGWLSVALPLPLLPVVIYLTQHCLRPQDFAARQRFFIIPILSFFLASRIFSFFVLA